jgi:hypothetical protein
VLCEGGCVLCVMCEGGCVPVLCVWVCAGLIARQHYPPSFILVVQYYFYIPTACAMATGFTCRVR